MSTVASREGVVTRGMDGPAWERFLADQPGARLYHHPRWIGLTEEHFRHRAFHLQAEVDGRLEGVLGLIRMRSRLFGDFLISLPFVNYGGVVAASDDARRLLCTEAARLAQELDVSHLELRDTVPVPDGDWPERTDKVAMVLDLDGDAAALWQSLGSKLRAQVKRPRKEGAQARVGGIELLDDFYRVFAENMRDLGTPVYGRGWFRRVLETFPDQARIAVVHLDDEPAAAGFLLDTGHGTLEIPWASSLRRFNRVGVNMLLYWTVLEHACEAGYKRFDFGRSSRDAGTYRFKKQWGAVERPLVWSYWIKGGGEPPRINPSNPKYDLAIRAWQHLPVAVTRVIGPPIVRNIP